VSGVAILNYLMSNNDALTAVVPAIRIFAGDIPLKTTLPAISVSQISGVPRNTVSMNSVRVLITERVQVSVNAKTYPTKKQILHLVMRACSNQSGIRAGIDLDSILPDAQGPDFDDSGAGLYAGSQDFIVKWRTLMSAEDETLWDDGFTWAP
jgi:hypothetical protein